MDYKIKLQTNNTALEGNNVDLQDILTTIGNLPSASTSINLDTEITEQESLIDQIQTALEGKAGNNLDTSDATATADDIVKDKTAYVNGIKIIGTHEDISIPTCTIVMPNITSSNRYLYITFLAIHNGEVTSVSPDYGQTLENVICGSIYLAGVDGGGFSHWDSIKLNNEYLLHYADNLGFGYVPFSPNEIVYVTTE